MYNKAGGIRASPRACTCQVRSAGILFVFLQAHPLMLSWMEPTDHAVEKSFLVAQPLQLVAHTSREAWKLVVFRQWRP